MAEEDLEIALLHQMQAGQDSIAWEDEGANGAAEGELPSNTEHTNEQEVKRENVADDQVLRALSPSGSAEESDDEEYDPASLSSLPAITVAGQDESRPSSTNSTRKPKTVGGFIADDSDEEYDADADAATPVQPVEGLQPAAANNSTRALSPSPLHNSVTPQELQTASVNQDDLEAAQTSFKLPVNNIASGAPTSVPTSSSQALTSAAPTQDGSLPKARLPHDRIGLLEDRVKEDPRGDIDAWVSLISEHRKRNKLDDARAVYERVLKVFPQAAELWVAYTEMELENDNFSAAENIFGRSLLTVANVQLWLVYLNYIRRRNDLTNDTTGTARSTVSQSYDFVLANIGIDKDSGRLWQDYIQFIRGAPGQIGGSSWQDQQKMDQLRKAYQRAVNVPMSSLNILWKEYDQFEMGLNKITGRKFLQEKSPSYMSARSANTALESITRSLNRTTLPKLPPAPGFEGDQDYLQQVQLWKAWISWEQEDPLVLKDEEPELYKQRVLYTYKQAVMALRFWPEIWVEAADWCFNNGMEKDGDSFLNDGLLANPESCLMAFKKADRIEFTLSTGESDKSLAERGSLVRAPFDTLLDTLYELAKQVKIQENAELKKVDETPYVDDIDASIRAITKADDDEDNDADVQYQEAAKAARRKVVQETYAMQTDLLSRTISFTWIALMRAMRRVQGKGSPKDSGKDAVGGSRKVFADARGRGKLTSDVYVAAALIEHHVYKDPAGTKIFERGAKLFPEDAGFTLEYLKHLLSIGDTTNARVTFQTVVGRLTQKPEMVSKAKPLYAYFHKYESQYGELSQIAKLEQRMAEIFPDDPKLSQFAARYSTEGFEPTCIRLVISPATQTRPKGVMQSIEQPQLVMQVSPRPQYAQEASRSPRPQYIQTTNSPKRPFPVEDNDSELNRPRKLARGESPLKGAAGRRLDQQKRLQQGTPSSWNAPPFVVPRDITFLLSIIPRADLYSATKFKPDALVRLLQNAIVPDYNTWKQAKEESQAPAPPRYGNNTFTLKQPKSKNHQRSQNQFQPSSSQMQMSGGSSLRSNSYPVPEYRSLPAPVNSGVLSWNRRIGMTAELPVPLSLQQLQATSGVLSRPADGSYNGLEPGSGNRKPAVPPRLWSAASWY
ncbi:related to mRNA 3'-end-processing protein rna-14 [Rhynchosporium graminicola]|uniref:mRNA 3'-end-processing protein RNA14 n=1 Tax=Rhynchosporium graminicola TaxID=2792576 RepID=A0A1E1K3F2_9HELO|nr:related to mRNA 3'-end-processing protein rna-14 [Rhynchosporium commune]